MNIIKNKVQQMKEHHFKISKLSEIMTFDEAVMLSKLYADSCGFPYPIYVISSGGIYILVHSFTEFFKK